MLTAWKIIRETLFTIIKKTTVKWLSFESKKSLHWKIWKFKEKNEESWV